MGKRKSNGASLVESLKPGDTITIKECECGLWDVWPGDALLVTSDHYLSEYILAETVDGAGVHVRRDNWRRVTVDVLPIVARFRRLQLQERDRQPITSTGRRKMTRRYALREFHARRAASNWTTDSDVFESYASESDWS